MLPHAHVAIGLRAGVIRRRFLHNCRWFGSRGGKQGKGGGGGGGSSEPAAVPPPRVAALFEAALAEGALQEREAAGMMRGVLAQLGSGKQTEDAIIA